MPLSREGVWGRVAAMKNVLITTLGGDVLHVVYDYWEEKGRGPSAVRYYYVGDKGKGALVLEVVMQNCVSFIHAREFAQALEDAAEIAAAVSPDPDYEPEGKES